MVHLFKLPCGSFYSRFEQLALIAGIDAHLNLAYNLRTGGRLKKQTEKKSANYSEGQQLPAPVVPLLLARLALSRFASSLATRRAAEIGTEKEKGVKISQGLRVVWDFARHAVVPLFFSRHIYIPIHQSSNPSLASIPSHHNIPSSPPSSAT